MWIAIRPYLRGTKSDQFLQGFLDAGAGDMLLKSSQCLDGLGTLCEKIETWLHCLLLGVVPYGIEALLRMVRNWIHVRLGSHQLAVDRRMFLVNLVKVDAS